MKKEYIVYTEIHALFSVSEYVLPSLVYKYLSMSSMSQNMTEIEASKNHQRKSSSFEGRHRQAGLHHYKSLVSLTLRKCYFEDEGMLGPKSLVCWVSMRDIIQSLTWKCWWEGKPPLSLKSCYFHYFSLDNWGIIGGDNLQVDVDCRFPTFRTPGPEDHGILFIMITGATDLGDLGHRVPKDHIFAHKMGHVY